VNLYSIVVISSIISVILTKLFIIDFSKRGKVVIDYYKYDMHKIPTGGGFAIAFAVYLTILFIHIFQLIEIEPVDVVSVAIISVFGLFGVLDDIIDIRRPIKIFLPVLFPLPLVFLYDVYQLQLPLAGTVDLGILLPFVIIPVYIMVTANLVNMHSGFNGLASGLSAIILGFLFFKAILRGAPNLGFIATIFGATAGFFWFEKYPSKIFLGNIGSMLVGSAIGIAIVTTGFYVAGFVMLIPHTINFLLYVYWRVRRVLNPEDERYRKAKFGKLREDGTIEAPNPLTLKWVLPYYFRVKEWQVTLCMFALTTFFCVIALFIPY